MSVRVSREAYGARLAPSSRLVAALIALVCLAPLAIGAGLRASPDGHGTHTQLGLPPCGWVAAFDVPCPTCGMTTAVAHAAHGRFVAAFTAQPFGLAIALGLATGFWGAVHAAATGSRIGRIGAGLLRPRALWASAAMLACAWAYKFATWAGP